jgi:hypothetical protein
MILSGLKWLWDAFLGLITATLEKASELGESLLSGVVAQVQAALPSTDFSTLENILGQLDSVVPITELVGFVSNYTSLWAGVWAYRVVKSWIPGLSS